MKALRKNPVDRMDDLEDYVCRASHAAAMAKMAVEKLTYDLPQQTKEVLWFAADEAATLAEAARVQFYKLGQETI